jgi:predicted ATPase with chaperone activity
MGLKNSHKAWTRSHTKFLRASLPVPYLTELTRRSRIEAPRLDYEKLSGDRIGESSALIQACVQAARDIQTKRYSSTEVSTSSPKGNIVCNADIRTGEIRQYRKLQAEGQSLMRAATPCCA